MKKCRSVILAWLLLVMSAWAASDTRENAVSNHQLITTHLDYAVTPITHALFKKLSSEDQKSIASRWGLSANDYAHYLWLMNNTPNGLYYADKNLDPNWVLGMNATSEQALEKYAEIAVKNERLRIQKELAFQRVFARLAKALVPQEKPIDLAAVLKTG